MSTSTFNISRHKVREAQPRAANQLVRKALDHPEGFCILVRKGNMAGAKAFISPLLDAIEKGTFTITLPYNPATAKEDALIAAVECARKYNNGTIEVAAGAVTTPQSWRVSPEAYNVFFKKAFFTAILKPLGIDYLAGLAKITPDMARAAELRAQA